MPLNIIRNDISKVTADAIVNTANPDVAIGLGVDSTIYEAAGAEKLLAEREKIGPMKPGQAAATPAFDLDAKYIIHTVGPVWLGGDHGEYEDVASCYRESLRIADELGCKSVAFPLISTGTYGFPKDKALNIAISEISTFLFTHDMTVYMVVYDKESFVISGKAFSNIRSYIEENEVIENLEQRRREESRALRAMRSDVSYSVGRSSARRRKRDRKLEEDLIEYEAIVSNSVTSGSYLIDYLDELSDRDEEDIGKAIDVEGETFQEMLFRIIDRKGLRDPDVYKKANIDRKLFSKIRSDANYQPSKKTALALAVALELNLDETTDFLRSAGFALSPSNKFDLIVKYCINNKIYNVHEINTYLFDYDQPLLAG